MLVQEAGKKILLLAAWPANWDVDFKLCVARGAVLAATVKDGKLIAWDIQPASRITVNKSPVGDLGGTMAQ